MNQAKGKILTDCDKKLKSMDIYWFSGTGNSLIIAKTFSEELISNGIHADLHSLPCAVPDPKSFAPDKAIAIIFPVYQYYSSGEITLALFRFDWISL